LNNSEEGTQLNLDELAKEYVAFEKNDKTVFQRRARVLQSLWREERGYKCGAHHARGTVRPLGSRLEMPWAQETLANFVTERIREVVRLEVLDSKRSRGKLFGRPRIFDNLLSSQPLCFNLFGELQFNKELASAFVTHFTRGRFTEVLEVEFEYSPSRSDARYSSDRSAFDVYLGCRTASGGRGFIGVEVKYHESLGDPVAPHRACYDKIAAQMGCFRTETYESLQRKPLQQLWRDHLLSGAIKSADEFEDALFVVLYPQENEACRKAVDSYRVALSDSSSFDAWIIEDMLSFLSKHTADEWPKIVYDRYCDFAKLTSILR
jgi:hypothetical protein